jgi:hypothetical protein
MAKQRIHLELLLGRKVRDAEGKSAGRIEEVICHDTGQVKEFLLGRQALMDRLSIAGFAGTLVHALGGNRRGATHRVNWTDMDLSDPMNPKLKISVAKMDEFSPD